MYQSRKRINQSRKKRAKAPRLLKILKIPRTTPRMKTSHPRNSRHLKKPAFEMYCSIHPSHLAIVFRLEQNRQHLEPHDIPICRQHHVRVLLRLFLNRSTHRLGNCLRVVPIQVVWSGVMRRERKLRLLSTTVWGPREVVVCTSVVLRGRAKAQWSVKSVRISIFLP